MHASAWEGVTHFEVACHLGCSRSCFMAPPSACVSRIGLPVEPQPRSPHPITSVSRPWKVAGRGGGTCILRGHMTAWLVAYVSHLLSLHCQRGRGAVAGRSWWSWKIGEAWLPKVLYRLLGNTLPRSSMTAHVRATPALSSVALHDGLHDRGALCQVGPEPKQMPAPCRLLPRHFAMNWSGSDTKVGQLSPFETCKAFAFHVALEAISTELKVATYELLEEEPSLDRRTADHQRWRLPEWAGRTCRRREAPGRRMATWPR